MEDQLIRLRRSDSSEWHGVREVCSLTGIDGCPISSERFPFFGEYWIGPYQLLEPQWTWAVVRGGSQPKVIGYLTGCPNSGHFQKERAGRFLPKLWSQVLTGKYLHTGDVRRAWRRESGQEPLPTAEFDEEFGDVLSSKYPAHLHMNLLPEGRRMGIGERLHREFVAALSIESVPGIHLYCGSGPLRHYLKNGFHVLGERRWGPAKVSIYLLGKSLKS